MFFPHHGRNDREGGGDFLPWGITYFESEYLLKQTLNQRKTFV